MFKYYLVDDLVSLEVAEYFNDAHRTLRQKLEDKYIDKILSGIGLVILVEEIANASKPRILPNDACALFNVNLRLLVFAPERNECITGAIASSDATGIGVSLRFFADIKIIPHLLPKNAAYDKELKTWYREENGIKHLYKLNTSIQFTVVDVTYNELNDASKDVQLPVMLILGAVQ